MIDDEDVLMDLEMEERMLEEERVEQDAELTMEQEAGDAD